MDDLVKENSLKADVSIPDDTAKPHEENTKDKFHRTLTTGNFKNTDSKWSEKPGKAAKSNECKSPNMKDVPPQFRPTFPVTLLLPFSTRGMRNTKDLLIPWP